MYVVTTNSFIKYSNIIPKCFTILNSSRNYALKTTTAASGGDIVGLGKGKGMKLGSAIEKKIIPVETDPQKLVNYLCGSNINLEGEDVPLRPTHEYPDWLWELRLGKAPPLEEMDPTTKAYWLRVRTLGMRRNNKMKSLKKW